MTDHFAVKRVFLFRHNSNKGQSLNAERAFMTARKGDNMAADNSSTPVIVSEQPVAVKGLAFTKQDFETLVTESSQLLQDAGKNHWSRDDKITLNGIYYASLAGLIRSGTLLRRDTGIDGFPEISMIIGDREFTCRENALYGILEDDAPQLITPYEDTFRSYVTDTNYSIQTAAKNLEAQRNFIELELDNNSRRRKKMGRDTQILQLQERYQAQAAILEETHKQEVIRLKEDLETANTRIRNLEAAIPAEKYDTDTANIVSQLEETKRMNSFLQDENKELRTKALETEQELMSLKSRKNTMSAGDLKELQSVKSQLAEKDAALNALLKENEGTGAALTKANAMIDNLRTKLSEAEKRQKQKPQDQSAHPDDKTISELNNSVASLKQRLSSAEEKLSASEAVRQKEADKAAKEIKDLRQKISDTEALLKAANSDDMTESLTKANALISSLKEELSSVKQELKLRTESSDEKTSGPDRKTLEELTALRQKVKTLDDTIASMKAAAQKDRQESETSITKLQASIREKDAVINSMTSSDSSEDLIKANRLIESLKAEVQTLKKKPDAGKQQAAEIDRLKAAGKRDRDAAMREISSLRQQLSEKDATLQAMVNNASSDELLKANDTIRSLNEEIRQMKDAALDTDVKHQAEIAQHKADIAAAKKLASESAASAEKANADIKRINDSLISSDKRIQELSASVAAKDKIISEKEQLVKDRDSQMDELQKNCDSRIESFRSEAETAKAEMLVAQKESANADSRIKKLQSELERAESSGQHLSEKLSGVEDDNGRLRAEVSSLEKKCRELEESDSDAAYSKMLPELIKSIDYTKTDMVVKTVLMAACMAGIVVSFIFMV